MKSLPRVSVFLCLFVVLVCPCRPLLAADLPLVVVISTGGTIASTNDAGGGAVPALTGESLVAGVPEIADLARIRVVELCRIDSSEMTPEIWSRLSRAAADALADPETVGVVVTHGTDTMAQGAFFLDCTIQSEKPVVFTGAMRDASSPGAEGPYNLLNAVRIAVSEQARGWGVVVCLNDAINAARYVIKTDTGNVQAFDSGLRGYLGYVNNGEVHRWADAPPRLHLPLTGDLPGVALMATFAGDDGSLIRYALGQGIKGLVVEGHGAGNVGPPVAGAISDALTREVPVVITSRVPRGGVWPVYGSAGGAVTLQRAGCILGGDLPGPKARLLLMLALAQGMEGKDLERLFTGN